jgi:hypothetical protein
MGSPLPWSAVVALDGGAAAYLVGRMLFLRIAVGRVPPVQFVAAGLALLLIPAARVLPALAALGTLAALLAAMAGYERIVRIRPVEGPAG